MSSSAFMEDEQSISASCLHFAANFYPLDHTAFIYLFLNYDYPLSKQSTGMIVPQLLGP